MTTGVRISVGRTLRSAYRLAGQINEHDSLSPEQTAEGIEFLESTVDSLAGHGGLASQTKLYTVTLTSGTADYSVSDDILLIDGDAALAPATYSGTASESTVIQVGAQRWNEKGTLGSSDRPERFWFNRGVSPAQVSFHPTPNDSYSVRFRARRLLIDVTGATQSPDLDRVWSEYLMRQLAATVKEAKNGAALADPMYRRANRVLERALGFSNEAVPSQIELDINPGWWP